MDLDPSGHSIFSDGQFNYFLLIFEWVLLMLNQNYIFNIKYFHVFLWVLTWSAEIILPNLATAYIF